MNRRSQKLFFFSTLLLIATACAHQVSPRYYMVTAQIEEQIDIVSQSNTNYMNAAAEDLLKSETATIGFIAPPWCIQSGPDDSEKRRFSQKQCIALLEALETKARSEGYTVVDYMKFQFDPKGVAQKENVDALLYIDNLEIHSSTSSKVSDTEFAIQNTLGDRVDADISDAHRPALVNRCQSTLQTHFESYQPLEDRITGASLTLKMVDVANMTPTWQYSDTIKLDRETTSNPELYYLATGKKERHIGKLIVGTLFTGLGIATVVSGTRMNKNGESFVKRNAGAALAWTSLVPFGVGIPLGLIGVVKTIIPPTYQSPIDMLCVGPPIETNPFIKNKEKKSASVSMPLVDINRPLTSHLFEALQKLKGDQAPSSIETQKSADNHRPPSTSASDIAKDAVIIKKTFDDVSLSSKASTKNPEGKQK